MSDDPYQNPSDEASLELLKQIGLRVKEEAAKPGARMAEDFLLAYKQQKHALKTLNFTRRELPQKISPHNLKKAGWGMIFPNHQTDQRETALKPLLSWRESQAGVKFETFYCKAGQSGIEFLKKHDQTPGGTICPEKLPYYLLIVASPEEISFEFQYVLSLNRAVGRIWFENKKDYAAYAQAVKKAEREGVDLPRKVAFFSTEHDEATKKHAEFLVDPLHFSLNEHFPDWVVTAHRGDQATKHNLERLMGGKETPGLLLISSHGRRISNPFSDELQTDQGAIACQSDPPGDIDLFTADDLENGDGQPRGLISLLFSCFGSGTPELDNYPHIEAEAKAVHNCHPKLISNKPRLSSLPISLLKKGALAVVGNVERFWSSSVVWTYGERNISTVHSLEDSLDLLLRGHRIGHALRPLNRRYAHLGARLSQILTNKSWGVETDDREVGFYTLAANAARNFILLGDPAVYLRGRPEVPRVLHLDPELVRQIERKIARQNIDAETWAHRVLQRYLADGFDFTGPDLKQDI